MKVKDAQDLLTHLRSEKILRRARLERKPFSPDNDNDRLIYMHCKDEIERIEELIYNMELEDSYDSKTLEFLNKYENMEKEI